MQKRLFWTRATIFSCLSPTFCFNLLASSYAAFEFCNCLQLTATFCIWVIWGLEKTLVRFRSYNMVYSKESSYESRSRKSWVSRNRKEIIKPWQRDLLTIKIISDTNKKISPCLNRKNLYSNHNLHVTPKTVSRDRLPCPR